MRSTAQVLLGVMLSGLLASDFLDAMRLAGVLGWRGGGGPRGGTPHSWRPTCRGAGLSGSALSVTGVVGLWVCCVLEGQELALQAPPVGTC